MTLIPGDDTRIADLINKYGAVLNIRSIVAMLYVDRRHPQAPPNL